MMLCAGRDLGELKYPENDLKYLYLTISKMFSRNIFIIVREYTLLIWSGGLRGHRASRDV